MGNFENIIFVIGFLVICYVLFSIYLGIKETLNLQKKKFKEKETQHKEHKKKVIDNITMVNKKINKGMV